MKYLFFDCHGGFDLQMAVSALIAMNENEDFAKMSAKLLPISGELMFARVKRCSMDAYLAHLECVSDEKSSVAEIIESSGLSEKLQSRLKLWHKLRSDGKPYRPKEEQGELCYASLCLSLIENIGADKIYISEILQGNALGMMGEDFKIIPSPHTELLTKMASLRTRQINIAREILEPSAAALLYILDAEYLPPKMHNVIKSGYGASDSDLLEVPNIARCILAEDGAEEKAAHSDFEALISDMDINYVQI